MTQSPMLSAAGSNVTDRFHSSFNHLLHLTSIVRTGKTTSALDRLVLVALHLESGQGTPVTAEVIAEALAVYFGSPRTAAEVQRCLDEHIRTSAAVKTVEGGYALSAATPYRVLGQDQRS